MITALSTLLGESIAAAARSRGDAIALVDASERVTYSQLLQRADVLAWELHSRGIGPGDLVGVCIRRSADLVIAVVGIIRSGAAYVPLDLQHPAERRLQILADAKPRLVVTDGSSPDGTSETAAAIALRVRQVQPSGPYAVVGYSYGGLVAFEVARELVASGNTVQVTVIIDAYAPGVIRPLSGLKKLLEHWRHVSQLDPRGLLNYVLMRVSRRLRGWFPALNRVSGEANTQESALEHRIRKTAEHCKNAYFTYCPSTYSGRLAIIRTTDLDDWMEVKDKTGTLGWNALCTGDIDLVSIECRHLDLFKEPYIADLARQLDRALRSAGNIT